jgi:predicted secreted protein
MGWATGAFVYLIVWWLVLFMVLPWGVRSIGTEDVSKGHAASAPEKPHIFAKMVATSMIAAILWLIIFAIIESDAISFRRSVEGRGPSPRLPTVAAACPAWPSTPGEAVRLPA